MEQNEIEQQQTQLDPNDDLSCAPDNAPIIPVVQQSSSKERSKETCQAMLDEESAEQALALKKKELRLKLMQVSQTRNRDKLEEIRVEVVYHRKKLSKANDLAAKLRSKYLRVVKSAKVSEVQLRKTEKQLLARERCVADEKMQLTRLSMECHNIGTKLYGTEYRLPIIPNLSEKRFSEDNNIEKRQRPSNHEELLKNLSPFLRKARVESASSTGDITQEGKTDDNPAIVIASDEILPVPE